MATNINFAQNAANAAYAAFDMRKGYNKQVELFAYTLLAGQFAKSAIERQLAFLLVGANTKDFNYSEFAQVALLVLRQWRGCDDKAVPNSHFTELAMEVNRAKTANANNLAQAVLDLYNTMPETAMGAST